MTYRSFCEAISAEVENRILSWYGSNEINQTQALNLIQNGYMLGGFVVDVGGYIIMPVLSGFLSISSEPRIYNQEFKRDDELLYKFYQIYELDFDKCKNADEFNNLQSLIMKDLYEHSMTAICLTYEFGG